MTTSTPADEVLYRVAAIRGNGHWLRAKSLTTMSEVTPVTYEGYDEVRGASRPLYLVRVPELGSLSLHTSQAEHFVAAVCAALLFTGTKRVEGLARLVDRSRTHPVRYWSLPGAVDLHVRSEHHAVFAVAYQAVLALPRGAVDRDAVRDLMMSMLTTEP